MSTTTIHDTETCNAALGQPCSMCRWASRQERELLKERLNTARRNLIDEIDRMQAEVNRLDEEYDALDDDAARESRNQQDYEADLRQRLL